LRADAAQAQAIHVLQRLSDELANYQRLLLEQHYLSEKRKITTIVTRMTKKLLQTLLRYEKVPLISTPPPRGVYLWGGVGTGKTMLMDLFLKHVPVLSTANSSFHNQTLVKTKRDDSAPSSAYPLLITHRVHFNSFMQEVHHRTLSCSFSFFST
jgi:predicted ATPase